MPTLYGRGTTWGRRQALGTRQARVGLCLTWEYSPRSSDPSTPPASSYSTKSYHQAHPRTFHEEPGQRDCGAEGYQPGGHPASLQATFNGDQRETEAPTAGDNEAEVEGKKKEQEPTQKDTKADASLLFFLELLKYKYSDQEAKITRSSLRTGSYYTTCQASTSLGDTNAHWVGSFC